MIGAIRQPCDGGIVKHYYVCMLTYNRCVWCGHIEGSEFIDSFERKDEEI